jgi:hypothetical protein
VIKKLADEWSANLKDNAEQLKAYEKVEANANNKS